MATSGRPPPHAGRQRASHAGLLHLEALGGARQKCGAAVRGPDIDAEHLIRGAVLASHRSHGPGQPLGAIPTQDQCRHMMVAGHHPVIRWGQEPVQGVVGTGVDVLDRPGLALTDHHEVPR